MAEATVDVVIENLSSRIVHEWRLFMGFDQDMDRVARLLLTIKATLADAEERQFSDRSIKDWLLKLKDVALILDDVIDECVYEALGLQYQGVMFGPSHQVQHSCLSSFHHKYVLRYKIAKKMRSISQRLHGIAEERIKFDMSEMVSKRIRVIEWRQTTSFITEPRVYGREEDKDKILNFLIGDAHVSPLEDLLVYPIVGMGGLGKTTLAKLIFNHEMIWQHFDLRIWVCVSEDFNLKRVTKTIIQEIIGHACEDLDLEVLQRRFRDLLQGKRYLLVLDDVWDLDRVHWLELKSLLACGAKGASVLITTRLRHVAAIMGTVPPHDLSGLSDNHCWELFRHRAFGPNELQQEELKVIGREIVNKCCGVPLAAKSLGDFLRFKREVREWLIVKENNIFELSHIRNSIMSSLSLSYLNLPTKLRQCFVFCAIFPKGEIIEKQHLIELWMANGFISSNEISDAEDVADVLWNDLYQRSFFQDIERDKFGNVTVFKMHDLLHDLAHFVAEDVSCITDGIGVTSLPEIIHHLSYHRNSTERDISIQLQGKESLRTCLLPNGYTTAQFFPHVFKCNSLRVLHCQQIEELSSSIGDLKHLRYLNLSGADFKTLPDSLCKLWNLQTLKLDGCRFLQKLPNSLIRLKALRHLYLNDCFLLSSFPPQIGKLTSLRILSKYLVGKERGFLLEELGTLKLKGDLLIKHLEKVKSVGDAKEANMSIKQLNKLSLSWDNNEDSKLQENVEEILEALQPDSQQLESLIVEGYKGAHFPQWMHGSSLQYLTHLELLNCESCLQFPALGKLPSLKKLNIYRAIHVKYIDEESYDVGGAFKALEYLKLEKLPNLIRLLKEDGANMFPCLSTLEAKGCPKFFAEEVLLKGLHSLKKLEIVGCVKFNVLADFQYLTCLEHLAISSCIEVEGLHEALQHMTALQELLLSDLPNLPSLPDCFENLPLLRKLHIVDCDMLSCFPTSLSSLERLIIQGCPELEKRCQKEIGEDWPKIAHIPHIRVGSDDSDSN